MRGMTGYLRRLLITALFLLLGLSTAHAAEEILLFDSTVEVARDGSLTVTEHITVRAEGQQIRRGIYRDFPLLFRRADGGTGRVGFKVLRVLRNGEPENWFLKYPQAGVARIYIGKREVFIPAGEHTYTIIYRTTRQLRFFTDFDELYWNVTGNFWAFPIRRAQVTVHLPAAVPILKQAIYTGQMGEAKRDAEVVRASAGIFKAHATRTLQPGEGLTVAIAFPKGVVAQPGVVERLRQHLWDMAGLWWMVLTAGVLTAWLLGSWFKHGRDPAPGVIVPRWDPPTNVSPAIAGKFLQKSLEQESDPQRPFIAALLSLGHKGYITLEQDPKNTLTLTRLKPADDSLPPGEWIIMHNLLQNQDSIRLEKTIGEQVRKVLHAFNEAVDKEYENVLLVDNTRHYLLALALFAFFLLAAGGLAFFDVPLMKEVALGSLILAIPVAIVAGLLVDMIVARGQGWRDNVLPLLIASPFLGGAIYFANALLKEQYLPLGWRMLIIAALMLPIILLVVFNGLLRRPTQAGRQLLDHLAGLRLFIETAEQRLLRGDGQENSPRMSELLYERLLPWAVAMHLDDIWTQTFRNWIAHTQGERAAIHSGPRWYRGSSISVPGSATSESISSSLAGSLAVAMPSHSSSGSSGGGGSGGGGGGGGGGGW